MKSKGEFLDTRRKEGFFEYQEEKYENNKREVIPGRIQPF